MMNFVPNKVCDLDATTDGAATHNDSLLVCFPADKCIHSTPNAGSATCWTDCVAVASHTPQCDLAVGTYSVKMMNLSLEMMNFVLNMMEL